MISKQHTHKYVLHSIYLRPSFTCFRTSLPRLPPPLVLASSLQELTLVYHKLFKKIQHTITFGNLLILTEMQKTLFLENPLNRPMSSTMSLFDSTLGNPRLRGMECRKAKFAPLGASLYPWGLQICLGLERAGSLTQLGPVADASPMASEETGGLWNCCQKIQVYQGLTRTSLSIEQTQTYKYCLRSHPDPPNRHVWKQSR